MALYELQLQPHLAELKEKLVREIPQNDQHLLMRCQRDEAFVNQVVNHLMKLGM
jgi:hypothetical protein